MRGKTAYRQTDVPEGWGGSRPSWRRFADVYVFSPEGKAIGQDPFAEDLLERLLRLSPKQVP